MDSHSEGMMRNLQKLFGTDTFIGIANRKLKRISLADDKEYFKLCFLDGGKDALFRVEGEALFRVEGDCCSSSWIEHVEAPRSVKGREIVGVTDERTEELASGEHECLRVYQTKFHLDNGETITLEYRNISNGYYGGYLVRVGGEN